MSELTKHLLKEEIARRGVKIETLKARIAKLEKVREAAIELEYILSDIYARKEIDSFTVQPLSIALKDCEETDV